MDFAEEFEGMMMALRNSRDEHSKVTGSFLKYGLALRVHVFAPRTLAEMTTRAPRSFSFAGATWNNVILGPVGAAAWAGGIATTTELTDNAEATTDIRTRVTARLLAKPRRITTSRER